MTPTSTNKLPIPLLSFKYFPLLDYMIELFITNQNTRLLIHKLHTSSLVIPKHWDSQAQRLSRHHPKALTSYID